MKVSNKIKIALAAAAATAALGFAVNALADMTFGALTETSSGALTVDLDAASDYTLGPSLTGGNMIIGGSAETGTITFGGGAGIQIIDIAGGNAVKTVNIASGTSANVIRIGNNQTAGSIAIGKSMTGGTINIGGTGAQTGTVTISGGSGVQIVDIAGGNAVKTVHIASGTSANIITIGGTTSSTTIAGVLTVGNASPANSAKLFQVATTTPSANYFLAVMGNGNISASGTAPTLSSSGAGSPALSAGSSNFAGIITLGTGALVSSSTLTFLPPFTNAPSCTANLASTTGVAISVLTTNATAIFTASTTPVTNIANGKINYICVGLGE